MWSPRPTRPVAAVAWASLTLLATVLAAFSPAEAGCGRRGDRPVIALDASAPGGPSVEPVVTPDRGPKPCSGPQCSGKTAPPVSPAPLAPPRPDPWMLAILPEPPFGPESATRVVEEARARPVHPASSIFHPPR